MNRITIARRPLARREGLVKGNMQQGDRIAPIQTSRTAPETRPGSGGRWGEFEIMALDRNQRAVFSASLFLRGARFRREGPKRLQRYCRLIDRLRLLGREMLQCLGRHRLMDRSQGHLKRLPICEHLGSEVVFRSEADREVRACPHHAGIF